jgi:hypothetical protein
MYAPSISPRTNRRPVQPDFAAMIGTVFGFIRRHGLGRPVTAKSEPGDDCAVILRDAHGSMRCGNPARSWRVLSEWLGSRGDQPEDYGWLCARIFNWEDGGIVARLTEARVARLVALRRSPEVLDVVAQRWTVDPHFRPSSAAVTLALAQIAARGGAQRISRILLSDFGARFAGDPRVSVAEALKRRLTQPAPLHVPMDSNAGRGARLGAIKEARQTEFPRIHNRFDAAGEVGHQMPGPGRNPKTMP